MHFVPVIKLFTSQPMRFSFSLSLILLPTRGKVGSGVSDRLTGTELKAGVEP